MVPACAFPPELRSLRDLTQHLTTRADDSHAAPVSLSPKGKLDLSSDQGMSKGGAHLKGHNDLKYKRM